MPPPDVQTPSPPSEQASVVLSPELPTLAPEDYPSFDNIVTEDGAAVDSIFSEKQMRLLTEPLYAAWSPERPFVALANVGLFYGIDLPPLVPDVLLSIDVSFPKSLFPKPNRTYAVWQYGKPPEIVIEIVSNKVGGEDSTKLEKYANVRVSNYYIYDPEYHLSNQELRGYRLAGNRLEPIDNPLGHITELGLGVTLWSGRYEQIEAKWLRWIDAQGHMIATGAERAEQATQLAEQATQRAEQATRQAEQATQQAESEKAQRLKLLELLRQHGIDPPGEDQ